MIKIYQQENFEFDRSAKKIDERTNIQIKIGKILIRATPIMECLNWYNDWWIYLLFRIYDC